MTLVPYGADGPPEALPDFSHVGGYAVVRRDAFTNTNFSVTGLHMLGVKLNTPLRADPSQHLWVGDEPGARLADQISALPLGDFDFVWSLVRPEEFEPPGLTAVYRDESTTLLRIEK